MPRLDKNPELATALRKYCRLGVGEVWDDPEGKRRIGCLDAADLLAVRDFMRGEMASLAIQDPPYNLGPLTSLRATATLSSRSLLLIRGCGIC